MTVPEKIDSNVMEKIDELKKKFQNEMSPSMLENTRLFYRFLKAQDFDIDEAEMMLNKHLKWRKEMKVENILNERIVPEEFEQYNVLSQIGFDKENSPVVYMAIGNMDPKGIRYSVKFNDRIRFVIKSLEEFINALEKQSLKCNADIEGLVFIIDMNNFSFANATDKKTLEELIYLLRMFQDNYPERLKAAIIINASLYFPLLFSVVKTFLVASIMSRVEIHTSEEEWKPILLERIDADVLPAFLGGSKTDPDGDPLCKSFVKHGGMIPSHLYICKNKRSLSKNKEAKKLVIPRAAFSEIELEVKEPGSLIEWEFETKTRDIGFGLFLTEKDSDGEEKITELVPLLRLDTEEFSETGMYRCEKSGKYVILFDNSYSWVRAKEIYYTSKVVTPSQHENEMTLS